MSNAESADVQSVTSPLPARRPWIAPVIEALPRLTELTLLSPIGGGGGTGGSTVFGLLIAAGLLFGIGACSDEVVRPSSGTPAAGLQTVTCHADVHAGTLSCAGPTRSSAVILGGQGNRVALRSTNVGYNNGTQIFSATITVQNLLAQTIGSDGLGVNVFFESGPSVTGGTGIVTVANPTGTNGTFDGTNQTFFNFPDSLQAGQISSPLVWQWNVPVTVSTFSFTVLVSATVRDDQGVLLWSAVPQFKTGGFTDIAVNSATDAMVVGPAGSVYRKVGSVWSPLPVQLNEDWVGVAAIGNGEYVGATSAGTVALFNGHVWNTVRNAGFNITGITAYAANRIAIGGDSGGASHLSWFGNSGWFSIGVGGSSPFSFLASYGTDQGVGATIHGSVYRFNFNSPTPSGSSGDSITAFYGAVGAADFGRAVFSGGGAILDDAASQVYSGGADTIVDAVDFASGGPVFWAAVRSLTTDSSRLMSWTAGTWTNRALLPQPVVRMIQDSTGGLYLLSADGIRRWNGSAVVDELVGPQSSFPTAIGGTDSAAFVGMNNGDIRRYNGTTWTTANPGGFLRVASLAVFSGGTAAALDTSGQFSIWNGSSWSFVPTFANARAIWGVDTTHMVMLEYNPALSGTSYVAHGYPFGVFIPTVNPAGVNTPLNAVWGTSDTDFWIVGNGGVVLHYNGASYTSFAPGTSEDLLATSGTGISDLWVGGTNGYLAHWNGSAWTSCGGSLGSSTVTSLWALGAGAAYAGQANGAVTLVDAPCTAVAPRTIAGSSGAVSGLSGSSATDLWALVGTTIFHGTR